MLFIFLKILLDSCPMAKFVQDAFYTSEIKDGKEIKKYISEDIKDCELFQNYEF